MNVPSEKSPSLVFVYGTLQRSFGNHRVMERSNGSYIGTGITTDQYPLVVEGLPYLHNCVHTGHHVEGEVFQVDDLTHLDQLEGHPHFYKREVIDIALPTHRVQCWTYFINDIEIKDFEGLKLHKSYREAVENKISSFSKI